MAQGVPDLIRGLVAPAVLGRINAANTDMTLSGITVPWLFIPPLSFKAGWKRRSFVSRGRQHAPRLLISSPMIYANYFIWSDLRVSPLLEPMKPVLRLQHPESATGAHQEPRATIPKCTAPLDRAGEGSSDQAHRTARCRAPSRSPGESPVPGTGRGRFCRVISTLCLGKTHLYGLVCLLGGGGL